MSLSYRLKCILTNSCNVTKTYILKELHCCKGFTTNVVRHNYHQYWYRESRSYLKRYGCPRGEEIDCSHYNQSKLFLSLVLQDSTLDCLQELGLTEFANHFNDSLEGLVVAPKSKLTVFAVPNEIVTRAGLGSLSASELDVKIKSHIVTRENGQDFLYNGQKLETLAPGYFIHVGKSDDSYQRPAKNVR